MTETREFKPFSTAAGLRGELDATWFPREGFEAFSDMGGLMAAGQILHAGRHTTALVTVPGLTGPSEVVLKSFGGQSRVKDGIDRSRGSKARRSWEAAVHLSARGVGTPAPLGYLERWEGRRIAEGYFLSQYESGTVSFADELGRLLREDAETQPLMRLLECVARFVAQMHAAGFVHQDLGNQNILMRRRGASWGDLMVIDLNRGRSHAHLDERQRARDLSRLALPSDFLRIFLEMYCGDVPSPELLEWERRFRRRFARHTASRRWRHPVRTWRNRQQPETIHCYPRDRDMWVWDERSAQALTVHVSKARSRLYPLNRHLGVLPALGAALRGWRAYRTLLPTAFTAPIELDGRIGVAIDPAPGDEPLELALVEQLGAPCVQIRFYHHKGEAQWVQAAALVVALHQRGCRVAVCLMQDRRAVAEPLLWEQFCANVLARIRGMAAEVEVAHAINRVKWGIWDWREYRALLAATWRAADAVWPEAPLTGPAAIDFEYHYALAALRQVPAGREFASLSHHLYVDRRGAPENPQGRFATVEKAAMALAMARTSRGCAGRVTVSEVNWPLLGTGVYSPVGAPYQSPGERHNDPSVSEQDYARFMLRYLLLVLCSGFVERVYWWRLVAHGFGLVDAEPGEAGRRRVAFDALRMLTAELRGATFTEALRRGDTGGDGVWVLAFAGPGGSFRIGWAECGCPVLEGEPGATCTSFVGGDASQPATAGIVLGPDPLLIR